MKIAETVPDKIVLMLSGGLDSAILLYVLCKYYDTEIITATGRNKHIPWDANQAKLILDFINRKFPNRITKSYEYQFDLTDPIYKRKAEQTLDQYSRYYTVDSLCHHLQQVDHLKKIKLETGINDFMNGTTAAPPAGAIDSTEYLPSRIGSNKPEIIETPSGGRMFLPWANKTKKDIADIYIKENMISSLYILTRSCIGPQKSPCGQCFWCLEKEWGFNNV